MMKPSLRREIIADLGILLFWAVVAAELHLLGKVAVWASILIAMGIVVALVGFATIAFRRHQRRLQVTPPPSDPASGIPPDEPLP